MKQRIIGTVVILLVLAAVYFATNQASPTADNTEATTPSVQAQPVAEPKSENAFGSLSIN